MTQLALLALVKGSPKQNIKQTITIYMRDKQISYKSQKSWIGKENEM